MRDRVGHDQCQLFVCVGSLSRSHTCRHCTKRSAMRDFKDAESTNALACIVVPSGVMTDTWQVMRSTLPWCRWRFATCICRVDGSDVIAEGEPDLGRLGLPAVVEGESLSSSKCNRIWCGLWHTWYLCNVGHCSLWCHHFREFKESWLLFTAAMH